jgi:hypothetical protein
VIVFTIFKLLVLDPFEYKKFIIYEAKDFFTLDESIQNENLLIQLVSDNYDQNTIKTLSDYYSQIDSKLIEKKNSITSSSFSSIDISNKLYNYYDQYSKINATKSNHIRYLNIFINTNIINKDLIIFLNSNDDLSKVEDEINISIDKIEAIRNDLNLYIEDSNNELLINLIKNYLTEQKDYLTSLLTITQQSNDAIKNNDNEKLRTLLTELTSLKSNTSIRESKFRSDITFELSILRNFILTTNVSLEEKSNAIKNFFDIENVNIDSKI